MESNTNVFHHVTSPCETVVCVFCLFSVLAVVGEVSSVELWSARTKMDKMLTTVMQPPNPQSQSTVTQDLVHGGPMGAGEK